MHAVHAPLVLVDRAPGVPVPEDDDVAASGEASLEPVVGHAGEDALGGNAVQGLQQGRTPFPAMLQKVPGRVPDEHLLVVPHRQESVTLRVEGQAASKTPTKRVPP